MDWSHKVSEDWLRARRDVVTATELQSLMAGRNKWTKAQRAGAEVAPAFAALWGQKHSKSEPDPWSYGPAARGHVMEPWAVEEYCREKDRKWHHWDDCIICNNGLGFSPDAMDVEQIGCGFVFRMDVVNGILTWKDGSCAAVGEKYTPASVLKPTSILEVKSYGIDNHMKNMVTRKGALKERYQIAVAMMVLPTLKEGILVQYNPDTEHSLYDKVYLREDLEEEIEVLSETLDMWNKACRWFNANQPEMQAEHTEAEIYRHYLGERMLDDVMEF